MNNQEAIETIKLALSQIEWEYPIDYAAAFDMAISALQEQEEKHSTEGSEELKQEVKNSGCTYKPDCPWYDGSKCNSPNDHGYHECDYDRGIFPESYAEELSKNSPELDKENGELHPPCTGSEELKKEVKNSNGSSLTQNALDTISRQAVSYLDLFTKIYCRDYSVTDDLVFRCKECRFEKPDGKCLVKCMARMLCPDYKEFGCMGDL